MKTIALVSIFCLGAVAPLLADGTNAFTDDKSRASYAIGMMFGERWKQQGIEVDPDWVARGLQDAQNGKLLLTEQEMRETLNSYSQKSQAQLAQKNEKAGEAFLAENKAKPGVQVLPDGLQYKVLTEGDGAMPEPNDIVTVNYRGTLIDGTEFDSSYKRGQPAKFPVGGVIRGWTEALEHMKAGSKWQLFIPADLAYGERGRPPQIPPDAALIFEVELLSVEHPTPPPQAQAHPANPPLTSDIIAVPSAEEMKKGKKPYTIKANELPQLQQQLQHTNSN
jgi:FKBP-type peptidyl-prolyl cis-trans isomerase FklB